MLIDAHVHIDSLKLATYIQDHSIACLVSVANQKEYEFILPFKEANPNLYISAGIHPWYVDRDFIKDMEDIFSQVDVIGEIGLDNTWCTTDLQLQKQVFEKQLAYASKVEKPVVLHTKGMEKEILALIKKYPNRYLVHWYSCHEYLDEYIDYGCYFSVGPSLLSDTAVYNVAKCVPLDKMLIETDGLSALSWCENREVHIDEYVSFLERSLFEISKIHHVSKVFLERQFEKNFDAFLKK